MDLLSSRRIFFPVLRRTGDAILVGAAAIDIDFFDFYDFALVLLRHLDGSTLVPSLSSRVLNLNGLKTDLFSDSSRVYFFQRTTNCTNATFFRPLLNLVTHRFVRLTHRSRTLTLPFFNHHTILDSQH